MLTFDRSLRSTITTGNAGELILCGKASSHVEPSDRRDHAEAVKGDDASGKGMLFEARLCVIPDGGRRYAAGKGIEWLGVCAFTLLLSAATGSRTPFYLAGPPR